MSGRNFNRKQTHAAGLPFPVFGAVHEAPDRRES